MCFFFVLKALQILEYTKFSADNNRPAPGGVTGVKVGQTTLSISMAFDQHTYQF
jgi:hypothetical protein